MMDEIWRNEQELYVIKSMAISGDFLYSRKFAAPFAAKQWKFNGPTELRQVSRRWNRTSQGAP